MSFSAGRILLLLVFLGNWGCMGIGEPFDWPSVPLGSDPGDLQLEHTGSGFAVINDSLTTGQQEFSWSPFGNSWIRYDSSSLIPNSFFSHIVYGNGIYVAVGDDRIGNIGIYRSPALGGPWTFSMPLANGFVSDIKFLNNNFIATSHNTVYTSADGVSWSQQSIAGLTGFLAYVFQLGTRIVLLTDARETVVSSDLLNWTISLQNIYLPQNVLQTNAGLWGYDINRQKIYTSADGITWETQSVSLPNMQSGVTYCSSGAQFYGLEEGWFIFRDIVHTSSDGINWTSHTFGSTETRAILCSGSNIIVLYSKKGGLLFKSEYGVFYH